MPRSSAPSTDSIRTAASWPGTSSRRHRMGDVRFTVTGLRALFDPISAGIIGPRQDLVMADRLIEADQRGAGCGLDYCYLRLLAGEGADRIHRVPEGQDQELDLIGLPSTEQVEAAKAGQPPQLGPNRLKQMPGIGLRLGHRGIAAPRTYQHGHSPERGKRRGQRPTKAGKRGGSWAMRSHPSPRFTGSTESW